MSKESPTVGLLDSISTEVAPVAAVETVRGPVTDPDAPTITYSVERTISNGALNLVRTTARTGKDKDGNEKGDAVKRVPLAPIARALALGVID